MAEGGASRLVAMTANVMAEDREACLAAGMDDYVAKPIRPEALGEALGRVRPLAALEGSDTFAPLRLDEAAIARLRELGGEEFLVELIDKFLAGADGHVAALRRSIDDGDADGLCRVAHTLKSSAATFGASELEERAETSRNAPGAAGWTTPSRPATGWSSRSAAPRGAASPGGRRGRCLTRFYAGKAQSRSACVLPRGVTSSTKTSRVAERSAGSCRRRARRAGAPRQ